jgi:hypothetical protein
VIAKTLLAGAVRVLAPHFVHPFGSVKRQRSQATLPDMPLIDTSCQNCHSERTASPWYSYLPGASWLLERDVAEARKHMNFSRWDQYWIEEKKDQLARIAAEVRSHEMPPARYTILTRGLGSTTLTFRQSTTGLRFNVEIFVRWE